MYRQPFEWEDETTLVRFTTKGLATRKRQSPSFTNNLQEQGLNVYAAQVRVQHIGVLKATKVQGMFFQDFIFHVKTVDLTALDQRLPLQPLAHQHATPKALYLLHFIQPGKFR